MHVQGLDGSELTYEPDYNTLAKRLFPWSGVPDLPFGGAWVAVSPGQTSTPHNHDEYETFFIVEGSGVMEVGPERRTVGAGDVIFIPPFNRHCITNDGTDRLLFLSLWWGGSQPG